MKIGIMTLWWSENNYGQLLQCYALQKYLRDMGHDAYLIRYDPRGDYTKLSWKRVLKIFDIKNLYRYFLLKKREITYSFDKNDSVRNFEGFRNRYIHQSSRIYSSYKELVENPPQADIYIVGSDQVWNVPGIYRARNVINAYLLNFGDTLIKRLSYAASFGKEREELDNNLLKLFSCLLDKFDYISVREKSGLDICSQCGIHNAELVPDPTMLLDAESYRNLYKDGDIISKLNRPYCFLYIVGNEFDFSIKDIYDWAQNKNIEVIYVTGNLQQDKYKKTNATIPEWVYLLEYAEFVITNSYHCTVFSLLFEKNFSVIPLAGENIGMNDRFNTLFHLFGIEDRYVNIDFSVLDKSINWSSVYITFQKLREGSVLNKIIQGN